MTSKLKTDVLETVSGSGTIALNSQLSGTTYESMAAGSVIQVVQTYAATTSAIETTSSSDVASGVSATITPKYTNSLILISFSLSMSQGATAGAAMRARMYLNGAVMAGSSIYQIGYNYNATNQYSPIVFNGSHTATSLASLTFAPYFNSTTSGSMVRFAHTAASYALTLTEIKQ